MKLKATIFTEGKSDRIFLTQFIEENYKISVSDNQIISVGGKDSLPKFKERFLESTDQNLQNLVIFDADATIATRRQSIGDTINAMHLQAEIFLFPNNQDTGDLEVLLENVINIDKKFIFDCFRDYEACLKKSEQKLNLPAQKTKIHAYLDLSFEETKIEKWNFTNNELWNLKSEYLNPLRDFLNPYLAE
jgi:predicted ATP-dependent endonuclease of OLD family